MDFNFFDLFDTYENPLGEIHCDLEVEHMFFCSAKTNLSIAQNCYKQIGPIVDSIKDHNLTSYLIGYDLGDEIDIDGYNEDDLDDFLEKRSELEEIYRTYLQSISSTHIFSASCLEAHINKKAQEHLNRKLYDEFEKFSLEAKWLFLPKIVCQKDFDPSREPYQGFCSLIKHRNDLVHYKSSTTKWQQVLEDNQRNFLGLTIQHATKSISSAFGMIKELSTLLGDPEPLWINSTDNKFFHLDFKKNTVNN